MDTMNTILEVLRKKFMDKQLDVEYNTSKFLSVNHKMLNTIPEKHWGWYKGQLRLTYGDHIYFDFSKEEIEYIKNLKAGKYDGYEVWTDEEMNDKVYPLDWAYATEIAEECKYTLELNVDENYLVHVDLRNGKKYPLTGIYTGLLSKEPGLLYSFDACGMYYNGDNPFAVSDYENDRTFIGDGNGNEYFILGCIYPFDMGNCLDKINRQAHIDYQKMEYPLTSEKEYQNLWESILRKNYTNNMIIEDGDLLIDLYDEYSSRIPTVPVVKVGERLTISEILFRYKYLEKKFEMSFSNLCGFYEFR